MKIQCLLTIMFVTLLSLAWAATPVSMASLSYTENFSDIANWANNFTAGTGASAFGSVANNATGTIPDGVKTTLSTATFVTGTTGGVQKGTGNIVLLSPGTTNNDAACAIDFFMNFTGVNAGTLSFDWATVFNSTGDRCSSLRVYASTDGTTFTELTGAQVLDKANNVAASGSITSVALPASFNNSATARLRFYEYNGTGGSSGSRAKISIDNLNVTATTTSTVATPTFTPAEGTYNSAQACTLSCTTSGATIKYTTNGTDPSPTYGNMYSTPIQINSTTTVKAYAYKDGMTDSGIATATYTIQVATPTFNPIAGTYGTTQSVAISTTTPDAIIRYSTDGNDPTESSTQYATAISVTQNTTIKAKAWAAGMDPSAVATAVYVIKAATPTFDPVAGTYSGTQTVTISSASSGAAIYYTTNGSNPTTGSTLYSGPVSVASSLTLKAIATHANFGNSDIGSAAYTITIPTLTVNPTSLTALGYVVGSTTSTSKSYVLSGTNLTGYPGDITVTGSTNYEVSLDNTTFSGSVTVPYTTATLGNTTIYVRLMLGLGIGTYNSQIVANAGGGAATMNVTCSGSVTAPPASAVVTLRPTQIDISSASSESAVLMTVSNYSSDDAKYRLYSSGQYCCWNPASSTYITSSSYADGPSIPGTPSSTSTWWIPFQAGSNLTTSASYRDRLGTAYGTNYQTIALPSATAITTPVSTVNADVPFSVWNTYASKYIILGYDATTGGSLISATSSALTTGAFSLKVQSGTTLQRIEVRDLANNLIESVTGTWPIVRVANPTFNPAAGTYTTAQNVTLSCSTSGATIKYSTSSSTGPWLDYSTAIPVSSTTTIWAYALKSGMTDSEVVSAAYILPIEVSNIAALRAGTVGTTLYKLTGEAVLTFQHTANNAKWIQDSSAAIMIYDPSAKITTSYNIGDGISNILGTLSTYNSLLEFVPVADPGAATSTGNPVVPAIRTLASLTSADQSKLIKVENATLGSTGTFLNTAQNIDITQDVTTLVMRTFAAVDYSLTAIPTGAQNITCLVGQFGAAMQISPRFLADFESYVAPTPIVINADGSATGGTVVNGGTIPPSLLGPDSGVPAVLYTVTATGTHDVTVYKTAAFQGDWYCWLNTPTGLLSGLNPIPAATVSYTFNSVNFDAKGDVVVILNDNQTLPVELSSFTALINAQNFVNLMWTTQSETGVSGFYIYRGTVEDASQAELISPMINATNTSFTHTYLYTDRSLDSDGVYYYWLQNVDFDGTNSFHGPVVVNYSTGTGGPGTPVIPELTELKGIFPNPFNPSAQISYSLKDAASVSIKVYNSRGQIVRSFENAPGTVGNHRVFWDGKDASGKNCSTGVYFVRMFAGKEVFTQKAVLVK